MSVAAGVVHNTLSAAEVATIKVAAQFGGSAIKQLGYDPVLIGPEGIRVLIVFKMLVENIC